MNHKYDICDIFMRTYSNGCKSYYMIIDLINGPDGPVYEILKFDDGEYDFWMEQWFTYLKKVA